MAEETGRSASDAIAGDADRFNDHVSSFGIFQSPAEGARYVEEHFARFCRTLERIPRGHGKLLEIGAAPFCMTLMIRRSRQFDIHLMNYGSQGEVALSSERYGEALSFPCEGINVERDPFPHADRQFDVVVCAEVIEHLTFYPSHMLCEIHRVLKRDGCLVLTTPNVLRLFYKRLNVRRILRGDNLYDPYSG